jgi:hypothetical protein
MGSPESEGFKRVKRALKEFGVLLESDAKLPSVAALIAEEPIRGSWWGHPMSHTIFRVTVKLSGDPDALVTKLVSAKVTWVHRRLWPALIAVGSARQRWQIEGLTDEASTLFKLVSRRGELTADQEFCRTHNIKSVGDAARELEKRLLVRAEEVHTNSGAHAKHIQTWECWVSQAKLDTERVTPAEAKEKLEDVVASVNERFKANGRLPWAMTIR